MLNRIQGKQVYRMLLVSILLVFSLSTVVLADDSPSANDPTSDLYPLWFSLQDIYESFRVTYLLLDDWAKTFLPNIESAVTDIKSYLYYNEQSAAYYLYEIKSALSSIADYIATISIDISDLHTVADEMFVNQKTIISRLDGIITLLQNGSGSSGSSSGTDLSGITTKLDTLTGLIGIIQLRADTLITGLESTNTYLSAVSTKLDGVATMVTNLNTANTYLSWISSDVEDVRSGLETVTGLIGIIQLRADTLITGLESTNTYLSAVSTKLDGVATMVTNLNTANSYLSWIDSELETATGLIGQTSVHVDALLVGQGVANDILATIRDRLTYNGVSLANYAYLINSNLVNKIATVTGNQEAILALLQEEGAFTTDLSGVLADLGTVISNQELVLGHLEILNSMNTSLVAIDNRLPSIFAKQLEAIGHLATLSENLITVLDNQQQTNSSLSSINDALIHNELSAGQSLASLSDKLITVVNRMNGMLGNQEAILALLQADGAFTTDLSGVLADLGTVISNQELVLGHLEILNSMNTTLAAIDNRLPSIFAKQLEAIGHLATLSENLITVLDNQQQTNSSLSSINDALIHNELSAGQSLASLSDKLITVVNRMNSMLGNQEALLALLQADGAFTTDLSGVLADLGTVISNQELVLGHLEILNSMNTSLVAIDNRLPSIFAKQLEAIGHLATLSENLITVLDNQQQTNSSLSSINDALIHNELSAGQSLASLSDKLITVVNRMNSMLGNQEAILTLLQEEGAFTTDLSGILANQQQTNSSLSSINDALIHNELSAGQSLASLSDKLITVVNRMNGMLGNQEAILALLQADSAFTTDLSGIEDKLQELIDLVSDLDVITNVTVENIENITIDVTNKAYEVFHITDSEGNEQNLADFSGDVLTISGRLLNFFFKVAFDDALDSVDVALDDMTEFYLDDSVVLDGGASLWE